MSSARISSLLLAGMLAAAPAARGEDVVLLQPDGYSSKLVLRGTVLEFSGKGIVISPQTGGTVAEFPASAVIEVTTPQTKPHKQGLDFYAARRIEDARKSFADALKQEPRTWVRQEILAMDIRCSLWLGDYSSAATRFLRLAESDPETRHFELIPLAWTSASVDAALNSDARLWLNGTGEVARLIGASFLLTDPIQREPAEQELNNLASSPDIRIQALAQAQLWRLRMHSGEISVYELKRWQSRIEHLPEEIRGGPYYLLGQGYLRRLQHERAALAFLWLPLVYNADRGLAARACFEAADSLHQVGQRGEAMALYAELAHRYEQTPYAALATAALNSAQPPATSPEKSGAAPPESPGSQPANDARTP